MGTFDQRTSVVNGWVPAALGGVAALASAVVTVGLTLTAVHAWPGLGRVPSGEAILGAALPLAAALSGYVTLLLVLAVADVRPNRQTSSAGARRPAPRQVRMISAALIAIAGAVGGPMSAQAATVPPVAASAAQPGALSISAPPAGVEEGRTTSELDHREHVPVPGWTPTRPTVEPQASGDISLVGGRSAEHEDSPHEVVVRRGDTLWDLAARHLGPQATDADVAEEWPRWYAANRDLIGDDPDLILPGQRLVAPSGHGVDR